jgi:hypothetical protein
VLESTAADAVIPCDDTVVAHLHRVHALQGASFGTPDLIERSLGPARGYPIVDSRHEVLSLARRLGIRVPASARIERPGDLERWHREVAPVGVLKADLTSGGNGVRMSHSLDESVAAWRDLTAPIDWPTSLKRFVIDRDPVALWERREQRQRGITIQELVAGRPANSMVACHRGKVVALVSVAVVVSDGPTGAATIVRLVRNDEMARAAELLAGELELSGFFGLDFMLDAASGRTWLIEMNPRCTQLGHLDLPDQGSLVGAWYAAFRGGPLAPVREPVSADTIAFFPQARIATSGRARAAAPIHHDVPWNEPALMSELLAGPRPQRQALSRLYHALRPPSRSEPVAHERISHFGLDSRFGLEAS